MAEHRFLKQLLTLVAISLLLEVGMPTSAWAQDATETPTAIATDTATTVPTDTPLPADTATNTAIPDTATATLIPNTATSVPTNTSVPANTATSTATATEPATSKITVVSHLCTQSVLNTSDLNALAWAHQLIACPSLVLPDDAASIPDGHITATDAGNPRSFVIDLDGTDVSDATFAEASLCEDDLGGNLNGVANDNRCWDQSGYRWDALDRGDHTLTITTAPATYTLATAKVDPASDDAAALGAIGSNTVAIDTTDDGEVTIHLFYVPAPISNQVTVIVHLCPASVTSRDDFDAMTDFGTRLVTCPTIQLPGNAAAPGGLTSGNLAFGMSVQGSDLVNQAITTGMFAQELVCEADRPADLDGNPNNNVCLDLSGYVVSNVLQGSPVTIRTDTPPVGMRYVGMAFDPVRDDASSFDSAGSQGTIKLDTSAHGTVTVHYFFAPAPPTATPTGTSTTQITATPTKTPITPSRTPTSVPTTASPTKTPLTPVPTATMTETEDPTQPTRTPTKTGTPTKTPTNSPGTGSLEVNKRFCTEGEAENQIKALDPGVAVKTSDFLGCTYGNTPFNLSLNGTQIQSFMVPPLGKLIIHNLQGTNGEKSYRITDTRTGLSVNFAIGDGQTTGVISLEKMDDGDGGEFPDFPTFPSFQETPPTLPPWNGGAGDEGPGDIGDAASTGGESESDGNGSGSGGDLKSAKARVDAVDSFEDLPNVGTAPIQNDQRRSLPWFLLVGAVLLAGAGLRFLPGRRR